MRRGRDQSRSEICLRVSRSCPPLRGSHVLWPRRSRSILFPRKRRLPLAAATETGFFILRLRRRVRRPVSRPTILERPMRVSACRRQSCGATSSINRELWDREQGPSLFSTPPQKRHAAPNVINARIYREICRPSRISMPLLAGGGGGHFVDPEKKKKKRKRQTFFIVGPHSCHFHPLGRARGRPLQADESVAASCYWSAPTRIMTPPAAAGLRPRLAEPGMNLDVQYRVFSARRSGTPRPARALRRRRPTCSHLQKRRRTHLLASRAGIVSDPSRLHAPAATIALGTGM